METYVLINIFFLCLVILCLRITHINRAQLVTLGILIVMTALFDTIIVGLSIVGYDPERISGIFIGVIPIEDFFYALMAALVVPIIWDRLEKRYDQQH